VGFPFDQNSHWYSHGFTFRKEGHTKIIEYDLTSKQKIAHSAVSLKRPNVLLNQLASATSNRGTEASGDASDSDVNMSDPEDDDGEPTYSDEEMEEEEESSPPSHEHQAPKAANGKVKGKRGRNERVMSPDECRAHLRRLFQNEAVMCSLLFGRHGPFAPLSPDGLCFASADMFFMEVIPVTPTRFRPPAKLGETLFEHPQNELLSKVLNTSYRLRDLNVDLRSASLKTAEFSEITRRNIFAKLLETLVQLQIDVNSFIDSSKNPAPMRQGLLAPAGVKQGLEKKEGLFRKNMMVSADNFVVSHRMFKPIL
jgi:DNA-directed RNA polymerase beta' subunit